MSSSVTHLSSSAILLTSTSMHSSTSLSVPLPSLPYMYVMLSFFFWQLLIHLPPPSTPPFPSPVLPQDHQLIQVYRYYLIIVYIYLLYTVGGGVDPLIIGAAGGGGALVLLLLVIIILVGVCVVKNKKKSYNLKGED